MMPNNRQRKLILHIGTSKTGTTSLQNWFANNRRKLLDEGVVYPKSFGSVNHRNLCLYAMDFSDADDGFHRKGIRTLAEHSEFCRKLESRWSREYAANESKQRWVISNEHLFSRLKTVDSVARVRQFLEPYFSNIEIYIHLRPQVDVAVSRASTSSKAGGVVTSGTFRKVSSVDSYYDYDALVYRWERVFGEESVVLVPFKRYPCMTSVIMHKLQLSSSDWCPVTRHNERIGVREMAFLNAIGIRKFSKSTGKLDPNRQLFVSEWPASEPLRIGRELAAEFQRKFDDGNASLAGRRGDIGLSDLTPDWEQYDVIPNVHWLDQECVFGEQLRFLVRRYNWEIHRERANRLCAEARMAAQNGEQEKEKELKEEAKLCLAQIPDTEARRDFDFDGLLGEL